MNGRSASAGRGVPAPGPVAEGPGPGARWVAVCLRVRDARTARRAEGSAGATVSVAWYSDTGSGSASVRTGVPTGGGRDGSGRPPPLCAHPPGGLPCDVHLCVDPDDRPREGSLVEHADVLVSRVPTPLPVAYLRVRELLLRHPGCQVAAVPAIGAGRAAVGVRGGPDGLWFVGEGEADLRFGAPVALIASVAHAWTAVGGHPGALRSVTLVPRGLTRGRWYGDMSA